MEIQQDRIESAKLPVEEPRTKTTEVQTVFRESEAQTNPYTPDYIINKENVPEVLSIANLQFGKGLPASMEEMELIAQMREKRAFENALPPTSDEASFYLRRKLMEELEVREWNKREEDIKRVQNERLNLLQSALVEREKDTEEKNAQRTEEIRLKKMENKERAVAKIQRQRIKVLRKMYKARKNVEIKGKKRDIIEEYYNYGSTVYAPITREGLSLDKKANKYEVQPEALSSYQGIEELSRSLNNKVFHSKISVDNFKLKFVKGLTRAETQHIDQLEKAQATIQAQLVQVKKEQAEKKGEEKTEKKGQTDQAYLFDEFQRVDDEAGVKDMTTNKRDRQRKAVILLQRLIRGRAVQNLMFEGKEKRLELIAELRACENYLKASNAEEQDALIVRNYKDRLIDGMTEAIQSSVISGTMDNLSKELVRLKQERKIANMVRIAEDDRRKREAEESGRRQAEQILRDREDVLYQELMSVHQGSVDSYLQNIFDKTIDKSSSMQAFQEAKLKAETLNKFIDKIEFRKNKPEVLIKDLVSSFLIPDVERKQVQKQRKFNCFVDPFSVIRREEILGSSQKDHRICRG